jgi:hypothetical protein
VPGLALGSMQPGAGPPSRSGDRAILRLHRYYIAPAAMRTRIARPVPLSSRRSRQLPSVRPSMAARIVSLSTVPRQATPVPAPASVPAALPPHQHVWRGASGRLYAHHVYALIECPPLPAAGYVLVRRDEQGRRTPLRVGLGTSAAPTLNLAEIRQRGAQAGASEVHVRLDAASDAERRLVACDLRAGLLGTLAAAAAHGPTPAP